MKLSMGCTNGLKLTDMSLNKEFKCRYSIKYQSTANNTFEPCFRQVLIKH